MDLSRDKTDTLADEGAHLHLIALLDDRLAGCPDVLRERYHHLCWNGNGLYGHSGRELVLFGVDAANTKTL